MKNKISKNIVINLSLIVLIVLISIYYASGVGLRKMNVFLSTGREIPIYSVDTKEKKIALTFDVAYGTEYIDEIVNILSKNDVKATFFILGDWISKYPEYIKKIDKNGHEIGNHSTTHPHYTQLSPQKMKEEIFITSSRLKDVTGKETNLFRPPYGDYNTQVVKSVIESGHYCIQWDVDSLDWTNPGEEFIFNRVVSKTGNGSIILFHNTPSETIDVLDRVIKELKRKGFRFVTVSELIYKQDYYIDHTGRQRAVK